MAIFKCKMCGGALDVENNVTVAECEYCGTKQTLPRLDDERKANLYDRANHFRRNNEFDKAMGIYEKILNEDSTDSEAYWSLVLCRYGIEYVEDPATRKRVPTVNRAQFTSIFDDDNYKSALQYADSYRKSVYEEEAVAINEIQKGILAISQKEEPFDVFICYKETDSNGRRTPDSVLANELYHELTEEGFKVFFSRITLEDKLGSAYEPYIFAALNSAKVMVVLGTKAEYFDAVWVRNEWSRYLALIKNGAKKMLIPAYRDMDPYNLPEEFSHLQAQDMSKLGFMQDLVRGIEKIVGTKKENNISNPIASAPNQNNYNTEALLKRAFIFIEDREWQNADEYCEKVLDIDPENPNAYLGKLFADLRVKNFAQLLNCSQPVRANKYYQKIMKYGDETLKTKIKECNEEIESRLHEQEMRKQYNAAKLKFERKEIAKAMHLFQELDDYEDSKEMVEKCRQLLQEGEKQRAYSEALNLFCAKNLESVKRAKTMFEKLGDFKDCEQKIRACDDVIEQYALLEKKKKEIQKKVKLLPKDSDGKIIRFAKKFLSVAITIIGWCVVVFGLLLVATSFSKDAETGLRIYEESVGLFIFMFVTFLLIIAVGGALLYFFWIKPKLVQKEIEKIEKQIGIKK